jgi:putative ABC transport system permease protein
MRVPLIRSWLTALRIARREMSRAKGRSVLVAAMIALPVCALGYAAASYDMFTLTPGEKGTRTLGAADAIIRPVLSRPITQDTTGEEWRPVDGAGEHQGADGMNKAEVLAELPDGSRVVPMFSDGREFRTATGGLATVDVSEMDLADPVYRGMAAILNGRAPAASGEVAMSSAARARFGDTIRSLDGKRTWTSVGTVEFPADLGEVLVFAPGALPRDTGVPGPDGKAEAWLADTPAPIGWDDVLRLNESGVAVTSRAVLIDPPDPAEITMAAPEENDERLSFVPVIVGLAMLEIVLLAGPAFAVGARRRRRSLALIAANGGTRAHLRRIVLADGVLLGLAGAAAGLALAVVLAAGARPLAEMMLGARAGGYRFNPPMLTGIVLLAVLTGLAAAAVPAFTAARANVVAALAGRRGVLRSKRRWLVAGLVLAGIGAAIATAGATWAEVHVIAAGLAIAQIGLVLCTPSLVGLIARLGGFLPPAPRIALRDTARNRAASAPAVSAVMAAVAGTMAIGVYLASSALQQEQNYTPSLPAGYVAVNYGPGGESYGPDTASRARTAVATALPDATLTEISETVCPADPVSTGCQIIPVRTPAQTCPGEENPPTSRAEVDALAADPRCARAHITQHGHAAFLSVVGGRDALVALTGASGDDLNRAVAMLDRGGVVVDDPFLIDDGMVTLVISDPRAPDDNGDPEQAPEPKTITAPGYLLRAGPYAGGSILSPAVAKQAGFGVAATGLVAATSAPPTPVTDRLNAALAEAGSRRAFVEKGPDNDTEPFLYMLAAASGLITLGAAGTATGLAAADGRADLSTLAAIGAAPGVRRLLSLFHSGVIAGLGSILGAAAGIGSGFAVLAATNLSRAAEWPAPTPYPLTVPLLNLVLILLVPLVAMLGAGLLIRSRLPIERRRPS